MPSSTKLSLSEPYLLEAGTRSTSQRWSRRSSQSPWRTSRSKLKVSWWTSLKILTFLPSDNCFYKYTKLLVFCFYIVSSLTKTSLLIIDTMFLLQVHLKRLKSWIQRSRVCTHDHKAQVKKENESTATSIAEADRSIGCIAGWAHQMHKTIVVNETGWLAIIVPSGILCYSYQL